MRIEMTPGWESELDTKLAHYLEKLAKDVHRDMVATAPRDTGRLANDLDWEVHDFTARIGAKTVDYAYFAEVGTRPHTETAPAGEALDWAGATNPASVIHHPGTIGTHFMRKALYKVRR